MNYYSHNIGDYAQATMHLSLIEDAIYSRLLRRYYAEETPIVDDLKQVCRWVGARSEEECEAVEIVLSEFFELRDGYWHNKRADEEIAAYQAKVQTNRVNGSKGGRPKSKPKETQPVNNGNPGITQTVSRNNPVVTLTNNQEPITNIPPNPQGGESQKRERKERIQLKTFIQRCKTAGEAPISEYKPLLEYVGQTGLPMEFIQIAWDVFKREFLPPGQHAGRLQADWRRHFLNYVQKGYYRLWYAKQSEDGPFYELSTQGVQAQASLGVTA